MADQLFDFMQTIKALTDENRVRILMALRGRELCVCQITGMLDLSPSTTSKHLSILRQARLIESHKKGKWVYYSTVEQDENSLVADSIALVAKHLLHSNVIEADEQHIRDVISLGDSCGENYDNFHSIAIHSVETETDTEERRS